MSKMTTDVIVNLVCMHSTFNGFFILCSILLQPNTVVDEVVKIVWKEQNMKSIALQKTRSITVVLPNKSVVLQSASVGSLLTFRGSLISTGKLQNPVVETNYTGVI